MKTAKFYEGEFYMFSNLSAHAVEFEGKLYPTAEHAYQASKFNDPNAKEMIREAKSPLEAKTIAHSSYGNGEVGDWKRTKVAKMESILRAKLAQHKEVEQALINSSDAYIVEDSPVDDFWGGGKDGTGENHLGKLWMKLRDEINNS